jgi:hypothetical protein
LNGVVLLKLLCKLIFIDCRLRDGIFFNYLRLKLDTCIDFSYLRFRLNGFNNFSHLMFMLYALFNQGLLD